MQALPFLTLHVRLTRDCNAHCDYCSSAGVDEGRMSIEDFKRSIDFIADHVFPRMGVSARHFLTIEYLGGEVLLIPQDVLADCVAYARERLGKLVYRLRDGAQSNLIGAPRRIIALHDLFEGNLGTSWDNHTGQRHIHGSAELYRGLLGRSLTALEAERAHRPGRVLVVDDASLPFLESEVRAAISGGYDLVLRPVFQGGSDTVSHADTVQMAQTMARCYAIWNADPRVRIEPFSSLKERRLARGRTDPNGAPAAGAVSGCPFQSDCAFRSLSLDPDGTLHICQEMADAGHYPLGNAIESVFHETVWRRLARRQAHLSQDCAACPWLSECGGGCMNEAIEAHGNPFAKTELCPVWKSIFREIEADIAATRSPAFQKENA